MDCWSVPNFMLIIDYTWHPMYPQKTDQQLKQSCKGLNKTMKIINLYSYCKDYVDTPTLLIGLHSPSNQVEIFS